MLKSISSILLVFVLIATSCSTNTKEKTNINPSEHTPEVTLKTSCDPKAAPNYLGMIVTSLQIKDFIGGKVIDRKALESKDYEFSIVDGQEYDVWHVFNLIRSTKQIGMLNVSKSDHTIRSITIINPGYLTEKCIGTESLITEFAHQYSDYEIGFNADNFTYYLTSSEVMGIKFNIDPSFFTGEEGMNPRARYKLSDFKETSTIQSISMSDFI